MIRQAGQRQLEDRVLTLFPTRKDAQMGEAVLRRAGIACTVCADLAELCRELCAGAAAVLVAEESLAPAESEEFVGLLADQPRWSEVPVLVIAAGGFETRAAAQTIHRIGNVMLLDRPVRVDAMLSAVRSAIRARQRQYQLRQYLIDREKAEEALRQTKAQVEAASRAKDQFLAMLSHELRTPLTPVLTAVAMALDENGALDAETRDRLEMVRRNVELEARLIDDLLDLTRIARGSWTWTGSRRTCMRFFGGRSRCAGPTFLPGNCILTRIVPLSPAG